MFYGYRRVSTVEQGEEGRSSLDQQMMKICGIAAANGCPEPQVFTDIGVSGTVALADRPEAGKLLDLLQSGDVIVASKLDRIFRSTEDALITVKDFHERSVGVILCDISTEPIATSGVGKMFFSILASVAEFERWRIAERMADGRKGKKGKGGHIGGLAPYGFSVVGEGREAVLVPVPSEQATAKLMVQLRSTRTLRGVCTELTRRGIMTRVGTPFGAEQVDRVVRRYVEPVAAE